MENVRVHVVAFLVVLAGAVTVGSFAARSSRGQSQSPKNESHVKPTALITSRSNTAVADSASPFPAADRNSSFRNDLNWTFGGKQQRGWYLYDLLINQTLNTQNHPGTVDFAGTLAAWQKKMGLSPSGVLDEDSLMAMVSIWQTSRLRNRDYAKPAQLVTVPSSDFYDPERLVELRQVERNTYAAYKRMVAAAIKDPALNLARTASGELASSEKYFKIISAFRSRE
jgi:hypothetical protein